VKFASSIFGVMHPSPMMVTVLAQFSAVPLGVALVIAIDATRTLGNGVMPL
jgi:hypothetical protein